MSINSITSFDRCTKLHTSVNHAIGKGVDYPIRMLEECAQLLEHWKSDRSNSVVNPMGWCTPDGIFSRRIFDPITQLSEFLSEVDPSFWEVDLFDFERSNSIGLRLLFLVVSHPSPWSTGSVIV